MVKIICISLAAAIALAAESPKTFTGVVTDTMCGAKPHKAMMKDKPDSECVRLCAHGQFSYALLDGATLTKLSDQKTPAKYAGQPVRVTGVYDEKNKMIKVASIEPVGDRGENNHAQ
jgi:hypothetical protein